MTAHSQIFSFFMDVTAKSVTDEKTHNFLALTLLPGLEKTVFKEFF